MMNEEMLKEKIADIESINAYDVTVVPSDSLIIVNREAISFPYDTIQSHENLHALQWHNGVGELEFEDDLNQNLFGNELFLEEVIPYVNLWKQEKIRKLQEQYEEEKIYNNFENTKPRKLSELKSKFEQSLNNGFIESSIGFTINADMNAIRNIQCLLDITEEDDSIDFMGYDNTIHVISYTQLDIIYKEVNQHIQDLYKKKWVLRDKINDCTTVEELNEIIIDF